MSDTATLTICSVFVAIGIYNAWRAWRWTEIPEVLEGREYMLPVQIPVAIVFLSGPVFFGLDALVGSPSDGSPLAVVVGAIALAVAVTGVVLAFTTYYIGRPRTLIAPIARNRPRRAWKRAWARRSGGGP
jgi:hypothetical protein